MHTPETSMHASNVMNEKIVMPNHLWFSITPLEVTNICIDSSRKLIFFHYVCVYTTRQKWVCLCGLLICTVPLSCPVAFASCPLGIGRSPPPPPRSPGGRRAVVAPLAIQTMCRSGVCSGAAPVDPPPAIR